MTAIENLWRDTRYAVQRLARDWPFTTAAVLILALGIGASTATFSLVNTGLFRRQPYAEPERLVNIYQNGRETGIPAGASFPAYLDIAAHTDVFAGTAATTMVMPVSYQVGELLQSALAEHSTSSYLPVLGLEPSLGRWFNQSEDRPGAEPVAVVGHHTWRTQFGADPAVLGRTLRVNSVPVTVIGVGPVGFTSSLAAGLVTDFWLSISAIPPQEGSTLSPRMLERDPPELAFDVKARLRDGVSVAQAQAAMDVLAARLARDYPDEDPGRGIAVYEAEAVRTHPQIDALLVPAASLVLTVVGLVLAIACSNLATLLLVRGSARSQELSVRLALGAGRGQLLRQLLTESLLLSAAGGAAGCALAFWLVRFLARMDLPLTLELTLDHRVLAFTIVLTVVTGLAFGLAPALQSLKLDLVSTLRAEDVSPLGLSRRWFSLKNTLVVVQVTVSVLLLAATGLAVRALETAREAPIGLDVERVAMLETDARYAGYEADAVQQVYEELRRRIEAIPGVESAVLASGPPAGGGVRMRYRPIVVDGRPPVDGEEAMRVASMLAGPGYFETLGIPLVRGRALDQGDRTDAAPVAVVNETMARRYFGTVEAVGRRFSYEGESAAPVTVVGVVRDVRTDPMEPTEPLYYRSFRQVADASTPTVLARTTLEATSVVGAMQSELREMGSGLPVVLAKTLERHVDDSLLAIKAAAAALAGLSLAGLGLASLGLHAVVAFAVSRRSRELGIRVALGARSAQVVRLVAREVAVLVGAGIALGLAFTWVVTLGMSAVAADLSASPHIDVAGPEADPLTFLGVAVVIVVAGLAAAYFPARRAATADPLVALRHS